LKNCYLKIEKEIHTAQNRVRAAMNGFIISAGCYVAALTEKAKTTAGKIGVVMVDVGDTACKVPDAKAISIKLYIQEGLAKRKRKRGVNSAVL
jgi:hypothetical protein